MNKSLKICVLYEFNALDGSYPANYDIIGICALQEPWFKDRNPKIMGKKPAAIVLYATPLIEGLISINTGTW